MWHSAGRRHKHCQALCKRLQHNCSPCEECNTCVVLMVHIRAQSKEGTYATGSMDFSVSGYEVPSHPPEPTRIPQCFWPKLGLLPMWLQTVLNSDRRSTWRFRLWELRDLIGGYCWWKICFSPPLQISLAGGSQQGAYRDTGITEMDRGTGSIYWGDASLDRHHLIIRNTQSIFPNACLQALLPCLVISTQFVWFLTAEYPIMSSHPFPILLSP